jgi:protein-tyrosine-phosphatase
MNGKIGDKYKAEIVGTEPRKVNAYALMTMDLMDIDISKHWSKSHDEFDGWDFDFAVTVCSNDPYQKSRSEEEIIQEFRQVREDIWNWMKDKF